MAVMLSEKAHRHLLALIAAMADPDNTETVEITGVDLKTDHQPGYTDIVVSLRISDRWVEIIRAPHESGCVIAHSVYPAGIAQCVFTRRPL